MTYVVLINKYALLFVNGGGKFIPDA
ncbi:uncharacterized protein METZ01_LOCUS257651 [marine metagenome]|uniref:NERD domain-containing protein n=1 Tax=marine metagenome TaxID=408172 RepID=A0A382J068_9ZZZZ